MKKVKEKWYIGVAEYETENLKGIYGKHTTNLFRRKKDVKEYIRFMDYTTKYLIIKIVL